LTDFARNKMPSINFASTQMQLLIPQQTRSQRATRFVQMFLRCDVKGAISNPGRGRLSDEQEEGDELMKSLLIASAIVTMIATPSLAQEPYSHAPRYHTTTRAPIQRAPVRHSGAVGNQVYGTSGEFLGADPDPEVRTMIQADGDENHL
jgi:hypothetical protein